MKRKPRWTLEMLTASLAVLCGLLLLVLLVQRPTAWPLLAGMLEGHKGKKVYSYLKKPVKVQVDAIVDELAKVLEVAECYEQWNQLRDELERYYKDVPREHLPLSQQKEFKAIKNMVIREAERLRLGTFTFEDARMRDEVDEDQDAVYFVWNSSWRMAEIPSVCSVGMRNISSLCYHCCWNR